MSGPIVIAAGGTGGHLFPAQALARELQSRGRKVVLVTDMRGEGFAEKFPGAEIKRIHSATFAGRNPIGLIRSAFDIARGIMEARGLYRRMKPAAVAGFGGYPSLPAMMAATRAHLPSIIHEQNAVLGRANRLVASGVSVIAASFKTMEKLKAEDAGKVTLTGNPVRPAVAAAAGAPYEPPRSGDIRLLVFGGSQGARIMSDVVPAALKLLSPALRARLHVVQQARDEDIARTKAGLAEAGVRARVDSFIGDLPERMAQSHLVIARSGASTVAEITMIGRPAIFVPYPFATDDHQTANAATLVAAGAAIMMKQTAFTPAALAERLSALFAAPDDLGRIAAAARAQSQANAASRLADAVDRLVSGAGSAS